MSDFSFTDSKIKHNFWDKQTWMSSLMHMPSVQRYKSKHYNDIWEEEILFSPINRNDGIGWRVGTRRKESHEIIRV